jgi:hypothetical protein
MDPAAALREATERNAREAREEREAAARLEAEAAAAAQAEADAAAKAQADAVAKAQAEADAKAAEDLARSVVPEVTDSHRSEPPVVEDRASTGPAGAGQAAPERERADPVVPEAEVVLQAPGAGERGGGRPEGAFGRCWAGDEPGPDDARLRTPPPVAGGLRAEAGRGRGRELDRSRRRSHKLCSAWLGTRSRPGRPEPLGEGRPGQFLHPRRHSPEGEERDGGDADASLGMFLILFFLSSVGARLRTHWV